MRIWDVGGTDPEAFHRPSNIEPVHSVDNNGRSGEEEQQEEEQDIKQNTPKPPARTTHRQVLPAVKHTTIVPLFNYQDTGENSQAKQLLIKSGIGAAT